MKNDCKCFQCKKALKKLGTRYICEDLMPTKIGEFPIYCYEHYKAYKIMHSKHVFTKQNFVGVCWDEVQNERNFNKSKCSMCKTDLVSAGGMAFYIYKAGIIDKNESLILCKSDFLKFQKEGYSHYEFR